VGGKLANIVGKGADANPVSAIADIDTSGVRMLDRQSRQLAACSATRAASLRARRRGGRVGNDHENLQGMRNQGPAGGVSKGTSRPNGISRARLSPNERAEKRTSSQSNQRAEPEKARRTTQISGMATGPMIA
jgi:hypothetical protein